MNKFIIHWKIDHQCVIQFKTKKKLKKWFDFFNKTKSFLKIIVYEFKKSAT